MGSDAKVLPGCDLWRKYLLILVTVGTQKFQMDRLLQAVDKVAGDSVLNEGFFVQSGYCTYTPKHCQHAAFLSKEEMEDKMDQCSILLSHAGVGSILMGLKRGKKVIVVPRLQKYGEHVDDHQVEIAESFAKAGYIKILENVEILVQEIDRCKEWKPKVFESNKDRFNQLLQNILYIIHRPVPPYFLAIFCSFLCKLYT